MSGTQAPPMNGGSDAGTPAGPERAPAAEQRGSSLFKKVGGKVKTHSSAAAGLIVILVLLVVAMFVYYNGLFGLGGGGKGGKSALTAGASRGKKGRRRGGGDADGADAPETEALIESINSSQGL